MRHLHQILCLLAIACTPLSADGNKPENPQAKLTELETRLGKTLAGSHRSVAKWAKSRGLGRAAYRHYMEAITLYPDDAAARRALGYQKRGKQWVMKRELSRADKVKGKARESAEKALDAGMSRLRKKGASTFWKLAKEAQTLNLDADRRRCLNRVLGYSPDDRKARSELGYTQVKGLWVRSSAKKLLDAASEGWKIPKTLKYETAVGVQLLKRKSDRMFIGANYKDAWLARLIQTGEATSQIFHQLLSPKQKVREKVVVLWFMPKIKAYSDFIQQFDPGDQKRKDWLKTISFSYIRDTPMIVLKPIKSSRKDAQQDSVTYLVANALTYDIGGGTSLPWILEGISWEMSLRVLGTKLHWSVTLSKSVSQFGAKNWDDHNKWKDYMRELVLLNQAPMAVNVLKTKNFNEIADERAAFAWSVTNWLLETRPLKLGAYCRALSESNPSEALQSAFGWSYSDLDQHWRKYVLANY